MKFIFVGIDPGLDGAVAALYADGSVESLRDTPTLTVVSGKKKKREYDTASMASMLYWDKDYFKPIIGLESVHAMPGQGVVSMFSMGRGLGIWEGIISAYIYSHTKITPQRWKKALLDGMGKDKDASRLRAIQLFPDQPLVLKKHHGRAEALLIAHYIMRSSPGVSKN